MTRSFPPAAAILAVAVLLFAAADQFLPSLNLYSGTANIYAAVAQGELWRLATSWLPHNDMSHLAVDVSYLMAVGVVTERELGRRQFLIVFLRNHLISPQAVRIGRPMNIPDQVPECRPCPPSARSTPSGRCPTNCG